MTTGEVTYLCLVPYLSGLVDESSFHPRPHRLRFRVRVLTV